MLPDEYDIKDVLHASRNSRVCLVEKGGEEYVAKLPPKDNDRAAKRFAREVEALKKAAGLFTVPVVDHAEDYSWYVMPKALSDLSQVGLPTSLEVAMSVLEAIAASLERLHSDGEVHRDLKPGNILRLRDDSGERWVVADFGVVRNPVGFTTSDLTQMGHFLGTDGWAAPEQRTDAHAAKPSADVYSAALIVAWMLTGTHPSRLTPEALDGLPIANAVARATAERPGRRYQTLHEFVSACQKEHGVTETSFQSLVMDGRYDEIEPVTLQFPTRREDNLRTLAELSHEEVQSWFDSDVHGLVEAFSALIEGLVDDHKNISFGMIVDPILIRGTEVLSSLLGAENQSSRAFAVTVFGAIADIHQFTPAEKALDMLDTLSSADQNTMRVALHEAGAWNFFSQMAANRFPSKRRTVLLRELSSP